MTTLWQQSPYLEAAKKKKKKKKRQGVRFTPHAHLHSHTMCVYICMYIDSVIL